MIPSTAYIKFWPGQPGEVDASLHLTGRSDILCHTYDDRPAIISIRDAHVSVTVTVPDTGQVTAEDLETRPAAGRRGGRLHRRPGTPSTRRGRGPGC